jgi:SWI/SNF-related matrix-associated actin-dependent regulator 1 of chromatin subfamily A
MAPQLHPHQEFALNWLKPRPRAALAMQQRTGKTPVALLDLIPPANVIVPAYLKLQWQAECKVWRPDLRTAILKPGDRALDIPADVWITNYEILQDVQLAAAPSLILDEAHYCKSADAKRTITTLALADRAKRVRWLTGTIMPNRSMELYPFAYAMRATRMEAQSFGVRYAGGYQDQWSVWQYRGNTNSAELRDLLKPLLLRITREQIGMLPNEWRVMALDLPVDEREKAYDLRSIERNPTPVAFEGLSDLLHYQGLAKLPLALNYLRDLLANGEGPLLVFAWHKDVIAELARAMTGAGYRFGVITGGMSDAMRQDVVQAFQGGKLDGLIGNIKAAGVGLPLHAAERVVFVEGRWTPADMEQAADRGVSMGRLRALPVDVLTVNGSIDEFMVRRCLEKARAIDNIIRPNQEYEQWHDPTRQPPQRASRLDEHNPRFWWRLPSSPLPMDCALPPWL